MPRWRPYIFAAVIAPIAFAVCAITGLMGISLAADAIGIDQALGFNEPLDLATPKGWWMLAVCFVLPGGIGAFIAALISNKLQGWYLLHRL